MSCADDPDCVETLQHIDQFLDGEMDLERLQLLQRHLEECPPCLEQFALMQELRWKVASSCGCQHAPDRLRTSILARITHVEVTGTASRTTWSVEQTTVHRWE